jgi:molybdopterin/thiamine biosynthesis adenylyltransferase
MTTLFDIQPQAHVRILDTALETIRMHLAELPPEKGAALFGYNSLISLSVPDTSGKYSSVSWDISRDLGGVVAEIEDSDCGSFVGTVHSHPRGVVNPSGGDVNSTMNLINQNEHLSTVIVAIVTEGPAIEFNHVPVGHSHRMSLHLIGQDRGRAVVVPVPGLIIPVGRGLTAAGADPWSGSVTVKQWMDDRAGQSSRLPTLVQNQVVDGFAHRIRSGKHQEDRHLIIPLSYPLAGPLLVSEDISGARRIMPLPWDPAQDPASQLEGLMLAPSVPEPREEVSGTEETESESTTDRVVPLVGELGDKHVLVAGLGSVGSRIAEDLVRSGVGEVTIMDPDTVSPPNIARSSYRYDDIGRPKTEALQDILLGINPKLKCTMIPSNIIEVSSLGSIMTTVDLVIGATDDMGQQFSLGHFAYSAGVPMVCCAMYKGAQCGEVVISLPELETACIACSLGNAVNTGGFRPEQDYGLGGRLTQEPGLGASIHVVASMASLIAFGLLGGEDSIAAHSVLRALTNGQTLGIISTVPEWGFFPDLLGRDNHQIAPQSVWCNAERSDTCPICGPMECRQAPV